MVVLTTYLLAETGRSAAVILVSIHGLWEQDNSEPGSETEGDSEDGGVVMDDALP